ncbi:MAG: T9SS type A sorting domain-containing protein, partial [Bacteroidales bacterium]|nr:T9SS type A sorting domain-containing protein [Bacteroidales bacterium]
IRPMSEYLREENAAIDRPVCEAAEMAEPQISLRSDRGELHITTSTPAEVTVWSLQGLPLWRRTVMNEAAVTLPAGVYIVTTPASSRKYSLKFKHSLSMR